MPGNIPGVLNDKLPFNVYRLAQLFRQELIRTLKDHKMTPEQWQILVTLWSSEKELNQQDISHLTLKEKQTVSRIVQRLERDGWITREMDPGDARSFIIRLTPRARKQKDEVVNLLYSRFFTMINEAITEQEQETLLRLCKKLRRKFNDPA